MVNCCTQWKLSHYSARMVRKPSTVSSMLSYFTVPTYWTNTTDNLPTVVTQQRWLPLYWELVCATASSYSRTWESVTLSKGFDWRVVVCQFLLCRTETLAYRRYVVRRTYHTINCSSHASDVRDSCRNLVPALNYCIRAWIVVRHLTVHGSQKQVWCLAAPNMNVD